MYSEYVPLYEQELNSRAAGEIVIRQTLAELDIWEVDAKFTVTPHTDSKGLTVNLIKYFNDIMNKVQFLLKCIIFIVLYLIKCLHKYVGRGSIFR